MIGIMNPAAGELQKKQDAMFRAMPHASRVMNGCCSGIAYLNAAESSYMTGDIQNATRNAYEAIFQAQQEQQFGIKCMAEFVLVRISMASGDSLKLRSLARQMDKSARPANPQESFLLSDIIWGWTCVKLGELSQIPQWIRFEEETRKLLPPVVVGREYLVRSDALLAENRYHELLAFMTQTDLLYQERGILYALIQNKITKSIVYHYLGDAKRSVRALNEAYALSNPNQLIIQYIEYGQQMRTVINAAKRNPDCEIPVEWLDSIYTKSSAYAKQLSAIQRAYRGGRPASKTSSVLLSKREREVLACLSSGLTRWEIADSLSLSINTVKSVLQSAYSKLGATKSVDAVQTAISLGLIDPPEAG